MSVHHPAVLDKVRRLREKRGYSQEEMADRLHISKSAYQRLESGDTRMDLDQLQGVAKVLETDPLELLAAEQVNMQNTHGPNGYGYHVEQHNHPPSEEFLRKMEERHEAQMQELQAMNARLLAVQERLMEVVERLAGK